VPRVISLISSATEILHALGALDFLVGRSHECDYPESVRALPVCTRPLIAVNASSAEIDRQVKQSARDSLSIYEVFDDVIAGLHPTHILTQIQCTVCAVSRRDVEQALARGIAGQPEIVSLRPDSLAGIWSDIRRVAAALGIAPRAESLIAQLQARMQLTLPEKHPTVACIEWMEPLMAAGNWTPELIQLAGGRNLFGEAERHSPWMSWDDLLSADPDVLILAPCGFDLARTREELYWMTGRPGWDTLRARVYLADGNQYFNRPGPRVVETQRILAEILHPGRFEPTLRGTGWIPCTR
jgi:iron complex transport system substrate-binding protein